MQTSSSSISRTLFILQNWNDTHFTRTPLAPGSHRTLWSQGRCESLLRSGDSLPMEPWSCLAFQWGPFFPHQSLRTPGFRCFLQTILLNTQMIFFLRNWPFCTFYESDWSCGRMSTKWLLGVWTFWAGPHLSQLQCHNAVCCAMLLMRTEMGSMAKPESAFITVTCADFCCCSATEPAVYWHTCISLECSKEAQQIGLRFFLQLQNYVYLS